MNPDSVVKMVTEAGALPWPILAILLIGFFYVVGLVIKRAADFKAYSADFPTHPATVIVGLSCFTFIILVAVSRLALGMIFPDGYDAVIWATTAVIGVTGAWGVGKRLSSTEYVEAKAAGKAQTGTFPTVNVEGDATVTATATRTTAAPQGTMRPPHPDLG